MSGGLWLWGQRGGGFLSRGALSDYISEHCVISSLHSFPSFCCLPSPTPSPHPQNLVTQMWLSLCTEEKLELRHFLMQHVLTHYASMPPFLCKKIIRVIVLMGRADWPHQYPEFMTHIQQVRGRGARFHRKYALPTEIPPQQESPQTEIPPPLHSPCKYYCYMISTHAVLQVSGQGFFCAYLRSKNSILLITSISYF